jgi:hypothetical protein
MSREETAERLRTVQKDVMTRLLDFADALPEERREAFREACWDVGSLEADVKSYTLMEIGRMRRIRELEDEVQKLKGDAAAPLENDKEGA